MYSSQNANANHDEVGYSPIYQDIPKEKADSEHKIINFADEPGQRPWSKSDDEDELDKVLKLSTARPAGGLEGSDVQQLRKKQTEKIQIDKAEGKAQAHGGQQLWRSSMDVAHSPNDSLDYQNYYNLDFPKNSPQHIEDFDKKKQESDHGHLETLKVLNDQQKAILSSKASTRMAPWDPNTAVVSQNVQKKENKYQAPGAAESFEGASPSREASPLAKHRVSAIPTFQTPKDLKDIDRFLDRDINKAERLFRQSLEKRYGEANSKKKPIITSKNRPHQPEASLLSQLETEESDLDQSKRYSRAHIQKRKMRKLMQQRSGFDEEYKPQEKQGLLQQRFGKLTRKVDGYYEVTDSTRANMSKQPRLKIQEESHVRAQSQPSNVSHGRYNSTSMSQRLIRRSMDFNVSGKFSQLPKRQLVFADESCGELPKLGFKEDLPSSPQGQLARLNKSEIHKSPLKKKPKQLTFLGEHQKPRGASDYGHFNLPSSTSSSASALHVDFGQLFKNERFKSVERSQPTSFATTQYIQPSSSVYRQQHLQPAPSNGLQLPQIARASALFSTNLLPNLKLEEFDAQSTHRKFDNITDKLKAAKERRQEIFKMKMLLDIAQRANQREGQAQSSKLKMGGIDQ